MRGWLFAFMLIAITFAAAPTVTLPSFDPIENPAFIGAIILLSVAFVALSYAVSSAIQNPQAVAWSKDQLRELVAGVVVVVLVYGAYTTANGLIYGITGHENAVELGSAALDPVINDLKEIYFKLAEAYFSVAVQQGTSVGYTDVLIPKLAFFQPSLFHATDLMPFYGLSPILQSLTLNSQNIMIQILSFKVVKLLLAYIEAVVPAFLLPMGFVFRIFPFTKRVGDTLIALCLGAFFMLPASLIVVGEFRGIVAYEYVPRAIAMDFTDNLDPWFSTGASVALLNGLCENVATRVMIGFGEFFWGIIFALIASAPTLFSTFFYWFNVFVTYIWPWVLFILQYINSWIVMGLIYGTDASAIYDRTIDPIVKVLLPAATEMTIFSVISVITIATITYTGTKSISAALGGEYAFYGISRLM